STSGSSTTTASPGRLNHFPIVASVTDSPSVGTRMSVIRLFPDKSGQRQVHRRSRKNNGSLLQGIVEQRLQLRKVLGEESSSGGGGGRSAGVAWPARCAAQLVEHPFDIRLDEMPSAHVAGLFLTPHKFRLFESAEFL